MSDSPEDRIDFQALERFNPDTPPPKEKRRGSGATKALAFLVPLLVLAAVPWFMLRNLANKDKTVAKPTVTVSASSSASASPSVSPGLSKGTYTVVGLDSCLRMRIEPGTGKQVIACLAKGSTVSSDGESEKKDGITWLHVHDPVRKVDGWASVEYLKKTS